MTGTERVARNGRRLKSDLIKGLRLSLHESYRLMTFLDTQRDRIGGKMTYEEATAEAVSHLGFLVLRGNVVGACRDLGIRPRANRRPAEPKAAGRSKRELAERLTAAEGRIAVLEKSLGLVPPTPDTPPTSGGDNNG